MEELYQLIEERLIQIKTANDKFSTLSSHQDPNAEMSANCVNDIRDLSQYISQIKRLEKVRIFKENELMESFYALKTFDSAQKKRFHERSYYFMKLIKSDFCYLKYKASDEVKEVAKLYLNFFLHTNMQNKIEEIRKVYSSSKCAGQSFLFLLMKWLIEMTRINLQNLLKEKISKAPLLAANKNEKQQQLGGITVKGTVKRLSLVKSRSKSVSKQSQSVFVKVSNQNSPTNSPGLKPQDSSADQTIKFINLKPFRSREYSEHLMNSEEEKAPLGNSFEQTDTEDHNNTRIRNIGEDEHIVESQQHSHENLNTTIPRKYSKKTPIIYNMEGSSVQLYFHKSSLANNYMGLLEDLDMSQGTFAYQFVLPRNPRKIKTGTFVHMDLDRRKEMINKVYKDLYMRNLDIEKSIAAYQTMIQQGNVLEYNVSPQLRKGENYCENMVINFTKMFPHLISDEVTTEAILKKNGFPRSTSPVRTRKGSEKRTEIIQPTKIVPMAKNMRSESSHDTRSQRKSYMDIIPLRTMNRFTDGEESPNIINLNPSFGYRTENRFRIMKKKMGIHHEVREYPHLNYRERVRTTKMSTENSAIFTQESLGQALTEVFNYYPKLRKEYDSESPPKSASGHSKEIKLSSYSICHGNKSVSISKVKSNQLGEFTIWDTLNHTKIIYPERASKRLQSKFEHFNLMHTTEINQANGIADLKVSPHNNSNRIEKPKK